MRTSPKETDEGKFDWTWGPEDPNLSDSTIRNWFAALYKTTKPQILQDFQAQSNAGRVKFVVALLLLAWGLCMYFNNYFDLYGVKCGTTNTNIAVLCIACTSFVSGATAVPGSALFFVILTMVAGMDIETARDSYLLIQPVVMCIATAQLLTVRAAIERRAALHLIMGGFVGVSLGLLVPRVTREQVHFKLGFASVWFAFSLVLLFSSICRDGRVFHTIPGWNKDAVARLPNWKVPAKSSVGAALCFESKWISYVLLGAGAVGGTITALLGPGADLCAFAVLVLLFRVSESVANSTAIIVVAATSLYGALFRFLLLRNIDAEVYHLWLAAFPAALVCGLVGAHIGMYLQRRLLIVLTIAVLTALMMYTLVHVRPWGSHHTGRIALTANAATTFCVSVSFFAALSMFGQHLLYFFDHSELHDELVPTFFHDKPPLPALAASDEEDGRGSNTGWLYKPKPFLTPQPHGPPAAARLSTDQMSVSEQSDVCDEADDAFCVELDSLG